MGHMRLAKWADVIVIAPASADLLPVLLSAWRMIYFQQFVLRLTHQFFLPQQ